MVKLVSVVCLFSFTFCSHLFTRIYMMIAAGVCVGAIVRIAGDANDFRGLEQTISEMVEMSSFVCQCVELSFK